MKLSFEHIFISKCFYNSYFVRHICAYKWFQYSFILLIVFWIICRLICWILVRLVFQPKHFGIVKEQIWSKLFIPKRFSNELIYSYSITLLTLSLRYLLSFFICCLSLWSFYLYSEFIIFSVSFPVRHKHSQAHQKRYNVTHLFSFFVFVFWLLSSIFLLYLTQFVFCV